MEQLIEFAGNHPFLVGALVLLAVLVVVNEIRLRAAGDQASPAEAVRLINDGATVLDVRGAGPYAAGHIVGARNIPALEVGNQLESLGKKKDRPVLVYCDIGSQSAKVAAALRRAAFAQVYNLRGGLVAWQRENLPVETGARKKSRKSGE
jgi:rhodanese-related sulfurtransferase